MELLKYTEGIDIFERLDQIRPATVLFGLLVTVIAVFIGIAVVYQPVYSLIFSLAFSFLFLLFVKPAITFYISMAFATYMNIYFKLQEQQEIIKFFFPFIIITYLIWLIHRSAGLQEKGVNSHINIYAIFFFIWAAATLFWSFDRFHGYFKIFELFNCMIILQLPLLFIRNRTGLDKFLNYFALFGFLSGLLTLFSKWYPVELRIPVIENVELYLNIVRDKGRAGGFGPSDPAASVLNFFIFVAIALLMTTRDRVKIIIFSSLIFMLTTAVAMTMTKGAFGALILGVSFFIIITPVLRRRAIFFLSVAALVVILSFVSAAYLGPGSISKSRLIASSSSADTTGSLETRIKWWSIGFENLDKTRLIGIGTGGVYPLGIIPPHFHSLYFSVLFELGLIGMSIFLAILIWLIHMFMKAILQAREDPVANIMYCMIGGMVTFFIQSLVAGDYAMIQFWWELGIVLAVFNIYQKGETSSQLMAGEHLS